jgi:hypothetical protein
VTFKFAGAPLFAAEPVITFFFRCSVANVGISRRKTKTSAHRAEK